MTEADRARWEARYAAGSHAESEPVPALGEALRHAPAAGRALDVACGRGRHAFALARHGYAVDAMDISATALARARERYGQQDIRWIHADLDDAKLEVGAYAFVVCVDFTEARLIPRLLGALGPRGVLLFVARPRARCSYGPEPNQVADWFGVLEPLFHRESDERIEFAGRAP